MAETGISRQFLEAIEKPVKVALSLLNIPLLYRVNPGRHERVHAAHQYRSSAILGTHPGKEFTRREVLN